jgi:hypoxanthine phosphoribosyltransferase
MQSSARNAPEPALTVLLTADQIRDRVRELATDINRAYPAGRRLHLVSVLKGGFIFLADLVRALNRQVTIDFVAVSSYGPGTHSSGEVKLVKDLEIGIEDRDVLLVEDIVDTGQTLAWLRTALRARHPRSLCVVSLLDKPSRRIVEVDVEHVGFTIEDRFVVGYGLDCAEQYRHLPYVAVLDQRVEDPGERGPDASNGDLEER